MSFVTRRRGRLRHAATLSTLLAFVSYNLASCADEETPPSPDSGDSEGGEAGSAPSGGEGGRVSDQSGGSSAAAAAAGQGGHGLTLPGPGPSGGEGGAAGAGGTPEGPISICSRLSNPITLAGVVAIEFDFISVADCRVSGIPWLYVLSSGTERAGFLNQLQSFNFRLWGCATPPTEFSLLYEEGLIEDPRPITAADVSALIEDYMAVVTPRLLLSPNEIASFEAELFELSEAAVTVQSEAYSRTSCGEGGASGEGSATVAGAGGESGADGAPAGAGGGG